MLKIIIRKNQDEIRIQWVNKKIKKRSKKIRFIWEKKKRTWISVSNTRLFGRKKKKKKHVQHTFIWEGEKNYIKQTSSTHVCFGGKKIKKKLKNFPIGRVRTHLLKVSVQNGNQWSKHYTLTILEIY